jgi:hypothetical protein
MLLDSLRTLFRRNHLQVMFTLTSKFTNGIVQKGTEYGISTHLRTSDVWIVSSFAVAEAYVRPRKPLTEPNEDVLIEFFRSIAFHLHKMEHPIISITDSMTNANDVLEIIQLKHLAYRTFGDLDHPSKDESSKVAVSIVRNVVNVPLPSNHDFEKIGRFVVLSSMVYMDFYKLCKKRLR